MKGEYYYPAEDKAIIAKAKKHFKTEGSSLSKEIVKFIKHHMELHSEGNPQQFMTPYIEGKGPFISIETVFLRCSHRTWLNQKPACKDGRHIRYVGDEYERCRSCDLNRTV